MYPYLEGITFGMGKDMENVIKRSPHQYSDAAVILNLRYYFVKNPRYEYQVPEAVENLLKHLETEKNIKWNEVCLGVSTAEEGILTN
jgi:hypothetical protein